MIIVPHLHRLPPKPPWLYAYYREHGKEHYGHCNWCGEDIYPGQRKVPTRCTWHLECINEYRILFDWQYARRRVLWRDKRTCQSCGLNWHEIEYTDGGILEVDHIRPLHQWEPRALADLTPDTFMEWYAPWLLQNLQVLCVDCHKAKTSQEAARRAAA